MFGFNIGNILNTGSTSDSDIDEVTTLDYQIAQQKQRQQQDPAYRSQFPNHQRNRAHLRVAPNPSSIDNPATTSSNEIKKQDPYAYLYDSTNYAINPYLDKEGNVKEAMGVHDEEHYQSLQRAAQKYDTNDINDIHSRSSTTSTTNTARTAGPTLSDNIPTSISKPTSRAPSPVHHTVSSSQTTASSKVYTDSGGGLMKKSKSAKVKAFFGGYEVDEFKGSLKVNSSFRYEDKPTTSSSLPHQGNPSITINPSKMNNNNNNYNNNNNKNNNNVKKNKNPRADFAALVRGQESSQLEEEAVLDDMSNALTRLASNSNTIQEQLTLQSGLLNQTKEHMTTQLTTFQTIEHQMDTILAKSNCNHYVILLFEVIIILILFLALVVI